MNCERFEREFFRRLNAVVEPAVRRGMGSSSKTPGSVIVLETTGFKSGKQRRTPLLALHLGNYLFVSSIRGEKSFWVKNLQQQPLTRYYLAGTLRESEAFVVTPETEYRRPARLSPIIAKITDLAATFTKAGLAVAVLMPAQPGGRPSQPG